MIGTSPFIGAGQFGLRAQEFRKKFLFQPEKMLKIMEAAYQAGARGMEVITAGEISKVAMIMKETYNDFIITGSTFPGPDPMIEELMNLESKIIFVHGMVSDRKNQKLFELIDDIVSRGVIPGIAVHNPISTLKFSFEHTIVKTYLIPINAKGIFMGDKQKLENMINDRKDCYFIGMKTLAAGKIEPQLAYDYIAKNNICSVSIGMVTPEEAKTSTTIALNALKSKL